MTKRASPPAGARIHFKSAGAKRVNKPPTAASKRGQHWTERHSVGGRIHFKSAGATRKK
jgi:hypothetical protein